ncbi:lysis protein, partial [Salmonella enterica]|nr:lysis protein [Salmonella enterica]EBP3183924.1 lysis protein [Salmonella enterica]EDS8697660.1 lysis protein [Salmonella enterica]
MDRTTTGASYSVSAATMIYSFLDSFTHDEWAAIGIMGGLFFGALTWITNVYFQRQR